jgi:hypothetical protein
MGANQELRNRAAIAFYLVLRNRWVARHQQRCANDIAVTNAVMETKLWEIGFLLVVFGQAYKHNQKPLALGGKGVGRRFCSTSRSAVFSIVTVSRGVIWRRKNATINRPRSERSSSTCLCATWSRIKTTRSAAAGKPATNKSRTIAKRSDLTERRSLR